MRPAPLRSWQHAFSGLEAAPVETPFIWTPDTRKERARLLHSAMLVFQSDMTRAKDGGALKGKESQLDAWRIFRDDWARWFGATSGTTWLVSATDSILDSYEKGLGGWRDWFSKNVGVVSGQGPATYVSTPLIPTSIDVHTPDLNPTSYGWAWWLGGAALIGAGIFYLWKTKSGPFSYPGSFSLFDKGGRDAFEDEKKEIRAAKRRGELTASEASEAIRDLEHDWFHYNSRNAGATSDEFDGLKELLIDEHPLDRQGYDEWGRYFGVGKNVYVVYDTFVGESVFVRADNKHDARIQAMKQNKSFDHPANKIFTPIPAKRTFGSLDEKDTREKIKELRDRAGHASAVGDFTRSFELLDKAARLEEQLKAKR